MQELQDQNENKQESTQLKGLLIKVLIWAVRFLFYGSFVYFYMLNPETTLKAQSGTRDSLHWCSNH